MAPVISKTSFKVISFSAVLVGLYPLIYFLIDRKFGLLQSKPDSLLHALSWNIGFYTHIVLGGISLLIGWSQFVVSWRTRLPRLHRNIGKIYVVAALLSSLAGIYIGCYATGGIISSTGFIILGCIWFYTTWNAYTYARKGQISKHQKMMVYSYAACCSAITLRIYLPLLTMLFHDFTVAYLIVAWLCWIPNIFIAYVITRRIALAAQKY